ncbi:hydroquinone glucosyltransferase [Trifolium repens]|nr:hydroquinone glucosyltransferase [Trifolium repens]
MAKTIHIAVISIPSFSHQSSIIKFCKRLTHLHHHIHVTCIFPIIDAPIPATLKLFESLPPSIHYTFLPPINQQDLPQDGLSQIQLAVAQWMPSFRDSLQLLCSTNLMVALVADPLASQSLEVAKEFNLLCFVYYPVSALTTSLHLYLSTLHEQISCDYIDHTDPIRILGCIPIHGQDLPREFFHDRSSIAYELLLQHSKNVSLADGLWVNTFLEMEESTIKALQEKYNTVENNTEVYLVGPIIQSGLESTKPRKGSGCEKWLDKQKPNSVLFVCFGSGGNLSQEQLNELALGLELSSVKFLWVLREPSISSYVGAYSIESDDDGAILKFLPHGFLERTKEQGLVVPFWAPQTQILSHASTGGFLTHCGWNSTLESIVFGVPMITWPLFGEQRMNSNLLTEGLKVGLKVKFDDNGIADRNEIAKVIRALMLSEERIEIQQTIEELKDVARGVNLGGQAKLGPAASPNIKGV